MLSGRTSRRIGLMVAGAMSVATGLALAWDAVEPAVVRAVPTGGLVLIVAMVVLPVVLMALAGAARIKHRGAAETDISLDIEGMRPVAAGLGVVRHESRGADRHERPHSHRSPRPRGAHRAVESGDGIAEL